MVLWQMVSVLNHTSKIAVIYKSKYGNTKKYAQWIAEEANADLFEHSEVDAKKLVEYDAIAYGGDCMQVELITRN